MDEIELFEEKKRLKDQGNSPWISKNLFGIDKPKTKNSLYFSKRKQRYKFNPVRRTEIYEPIRNNNYYMNLKNKGEDKDDILCGVHGNTIRINKLLFDCFTVAKLNSGERQLFQWVLSNTTGMHRREIKLNVMSIAKDIDRSRSFVYGKVHDLSKKKMIFITKIKRSDLLSVYINTMPNTWSDVGSKVSEVLQAEMESLNEDEDLL
jgi:hypothetical protein